MITKLCGICKETLPIESFHKCSREKSGYQQWCKTCRKSHNHEERKQYFRDFYHANPEKYLNHTYKKNYGITLEEYNEMLAQQKGVCAICSNTCNSFRRLAVDHDHATGKIRGLLCGNCNKGLGVYHDNIQLLQNAIKYLENHNAKYNY